MVISFAPLMAMVIVSLSLRKARTWRDWRPVPLQVGGLRWGWCGKYSIPSYHIGICIIHKYTICSNHFDTYYYIQFLIYVCMSSCRATSSITACDTFCWFAHLSTSKRLLKGHSSMVNGGNWLRGSRILFTLWQPLWNETAISIHFYRILGIWGSLFTAVHHQPGTSLPGWPDLKGWRLRHPGFVGSHWKKLSF